MMKCYSLISFIGHALFRQSATHYQVIMMFPMLVLNTVITYSVLIVGLVLPVGLDLCSPEIL